MAQTIGCLPNDRSPDEPDHVAAWLNLSHELRTPAHAILGHVELLLSGMSGPISGEMRAGLGDIQCAALALSARIGQIVELAEGLPYPPPSRTLDRACRKVTGGTPKTPGGET